jgi:sec-independent protein translocase protein TatA
MVFIGVTSVALPSLPQLPIAGHSDAHLCDNRRLKKGAARVVARGGISMGDLLQPWHIVVLVVLAFVLFGAKRLPEMGKGLGEGLKGFKEGLKGISDPPPPPPPPAQQQNTPPPPPVSNAPIEPK